MSMRDWLLIIGGLLIIGVLAHGAWVYWRQRRVSRFTYERDVPDMGVDDLDLLRSELPSGGARKIGEIDDQAVPVRGSVTAAGNARRRDPSPGRKPIIPVARARSVSTDDPAPEDESPGPSVSEPVAEQGAADTPLRASRDEPDDELPPLAADAPMVDEPAAREPAPAARQEPPRKPARKAQPTPEPEESEDDFDTDFEDVLVINVLCRDRKVMEGPALLDVVTEAGMQFGDMNIFHRHDADQRPEFSMASAVKPGTFDLSVIDDFTTPGVSFFMRLPGPSDPQGAFERMATVAATLAERMGAEMKDERHSVMTAQTLEHCRQRIGEFRRRQMSRRG